MKRWWTRLYPPAGCTPVRFSPQVDLRSEEGAERGRRLAEAARALVDPRTGRADLPLTRRIASCM